MLLIVGALFDGILSDPWEETLVSGCSKLHTAIESCLGTRFFRRDAFRRAANAQCNFQKREYDFVYD